MAQATDSVGLSQATGVIPDEKLRGMLNALRAIEVTDFNSRNIIVEAGDSGALQSVSLAPDSAGLSSSDTLNEAEASIVNSAYDWTGRRTGTLALYGVYAEIGELAIMDASRDATGGLGLTGATIEAMRKDSSEQKDVIVNATVSSHTNEMAGFDSSTVLDEDNFYSAEAAYMAANTDTAEGYSFTCHPTVLHGQLKKALRLTDASFVTMNPQLRELGMRAQGIIGGIGGCALLSSGHVQVASSAYRNYFAPMGENHGGILVWRQRFPGLFGAEERLSPGGLISLRLEPKSTAGSFQASVRQRLAVAIGRSANVLVVPTSTAIA